MRVVVACSLSRCKVFYVADCGEKSQRRLTSAGVIIFTNIVSMSDISLKAYFCLCVYNAGTGMISVYMSSLVLARSQIHA